MLDGRVAHHKTDVNIDPGVAYKWGLRVNGRRAEDLEKLLKNVLLVVNGG